MFDAGLKGLRFRLQSVIIVAAFIFTALLSVGGIALASDITTATYFGTIRITNNSTATENVSTVMTLSSADLISQGWVDTDFTRVAVRTSAGADAVFSPSINATVPWVLWVPSIGDTTSLDYILYTGPSDLSATKYYFPGTGGMTVPDTVTEIGDNFSIDLTDIFLNMSATLEIDDYLDFTRGNSDFVNFGDDNDFSFVTAGVDEPFSITAWIYIEDATSSTIISKSTTGAFEWYFNFNGSDRLYFNVANPAGSAYRGRSTDAVTSLEDSWAHIAATYDGSEANAGVNIYIDGVDSDANDEGGGSYTGMTAGSTNMTMGAINEGAATFMDGGIAQLKIYSVELSQAEVVADYGGQHRTDDLVAYYEIDEGSGNPQDSSGNSHHAVSNVADWSTGAGITQEPPIFYKPGAISATVSGSENITMRIGAGANLTLDGVATGSYSTFSVSADTANLTAVLDEGLASEITGTITLGGVPVPDNTAIWAFFPGNTTVLYVDTTSITVDGVLAGSWDWEYATTFTDDSVNSNTATPSFRATSSDADVGAALVSYEAIDAATAPAYAVGTPPDFITAAITTSGNFTTGNITTGGDMPGTTLVDEAAASSGTPNIWLWGILGGMTVVMSGLFISYMERHHGSGGGTTILRMVIALVIFGFLTAIDKFDFWMLVLYLFIAIAPAIASRQIEWGGSMGQLNLIGFLSMTWVGMTLINRIQEGLLLTSAETSHFNTLTFTQEFNLLNVFHLPILNFEFFTEGIPSLLAWDYTFFGGNAQLIQYMLYSITAIVSFVVLLVIIGTVSNYFARTS